MEFQHFTIAGKQYDNHIVCLTENILHALKKSRGIMVSFGDKVMVYAGNLKELCQIYPKHRIEFDVSDGKVAFVVDDDGVNVRGNFTHQNPFKTPYDKQAIIYRGKKVHINEILVLSWSYVHHPVIEAMYEPVEPPTMPAEQPDPVDVPTSTPKARKPRVACPKTVKKSNFIYRPANYWYPVGGIAYA